MTRKLPQRQRHRTTKGTEMFRAFRIQNWFSFVKLKLLALHKDLNFRPKISLGKPTLSFVASVLSWRTGGWNPARLYLPNGNRKASSPPQHSEQGSRAVWDPKISFNHPCLQNLFSLLIPLVPKLQELKVLVRIMHK